MKPLIDVKQKNSVSLKSYTTFKIGGIADRLFEVYSADALMQILDTYKNDLVLLGRGSNVLISDKGLRTPCIVVKTRGITFDNGICIAEAGESLAALSKLYLSKGFSGLEWAASIPASVGGAVKMNAGAFGGSVAQSLVWTEVYTNGKLQKIAVLESGFSYRKSGFSDNSVIIRAAFKYSKANLAELHNAYYYNICKRRTLQPQGASAGSIFLAAQKPAGWYIDQAGLKGLKIGGAIVSPKHANFILNAGGATAENVAALIDIIKSEVNLKFGVQLKEEIKYLGEF